MNNKLEHSIMLVPLADVGIPAQVTIPTFTFPGGASEGTNVEFGKPVPVHFWGGNLIRLYLVRWEQNSEIIAAVPCDFVPTEDQMDSAKRLLRGTFRSKSIPWPGE